MPASALRLVRARARPPPAPLPPRVPGRPSSGAGPPDAPLARPPPEEELVRLWHGQHLPPDALVTRRGERLRTVYRGRRSMGPGPDFRDAIIEGPGGRLWRGDIEVHVRASGFRQHGHDRDPAYDNLALHLVWEDDEGEDTLLCCGRRVAVVALASWFRRRREELARLLERPDAWREPCFGALDRLGAEAVGGTLDRLGDLRFRQKVGALRRVLSAEDADQVLYAAVLEALGYGGQREAFARLAQDLPYRRLPASAPGHSGHETVARLETALLGATGVAASAAPGLWRLRGLRPANHPRRRLAGAARLLARADRGLAAYARGGLADGFSPAAAISAWTVGSGDDGRPALIGRSRAVELLVNGVLPFLAAGGAGADEALQERALDLFQRLPAAGAYGATAHLERALAARSGRHLTGSARRQQGLLYLLRQYCQQGGCVGGCPLA